MFQKVNKKITAGITFALMTGVLPSMAFANPGMMDKAAEVAAEKQAAADQTAAKAFADLPAGHWAYDAVEQLAEDGVVVGYEDGLFKGDRKATRYEMAQVVARAMALQDKANQADKMLIHRLAVEFADELDNLGVRVSNLEKKVDNVKWNGELRYNIQNRDKAWSNHRDSVTEFRLNPTATVNDHFKVAGQLSAYVDEDKSDMKVHLDRAYVEADYGKMPLNVKLGQIGFSDDSGLLFDSDYDSFRGGKVTFGNTLKVTAGGGRWEGDNIPIYGPFFVPWTDEGSANEYIAKKLDNQADYQFVGAQYDNGKLFGGAAYHHLKSKDFVGEPAYNRANDKGEVDLWTLNAGYRFNDDVTINGAYAKNDKATIGDTSKSVSIAYKGAKADAKNSWGVYASYKDLGANTTFNPSGFGIEKLADEGLKGYQFGASYTPWKNVTVMGSYFNGKNIQADNTETDANGLEGRVSFAF